MSDHTWVLENLAGYCADGLNPDEREKLEKHISQCAECARALDELRSLDQELENLFGPVRLQPGLENRLIQNLRTVTTRRSLDFSFYLKIAAGIAAMVLLGAVGALFHNLAAKDRLIFPGNSHSSESLNFLGLVARSDSNQSEKLFDSRTSVGTPDRKIPLEKTEDLFSQDNGKKESLEEIDERETRKIAKQKSEAILTDVNGNILWEKVTDSKFHKKEKFHPHSETATLQNLQDMEKDKFSPEMKNASRNILLTVKEPQTGNLLQRKELKSNSEFFGSIVWNEKALEDASKRTSDAKVQGGRVAGIQPTAQLPREKDEASYYESASKGRFQDGADKKNHYYFFTPLFRDAQAKPARPDAPPNQAHLGAEKKEPLLLAQGKKTDNGKRGQGEAQPEEAKPDSKIIKTGEVEFEVESFDQAVKVIETLLPSTKGGFITTLNSQKLENGKVRGSVVVRLPPQNLGQFLLDLRKELKGDLKSQRLGSQDVTKQYTDVESELRAARAMEDRILSIIKTGKGEIKDLIAAEHELGLWRTKIEKMEGEKRYFDNQVSLSTLTVTLFEKEIQAAAALVVSDRVNMRVEVEDVEAKLKEAQARVAEEKGRVTKSELQQRANGQLDAVLQFEVAPVKKEKVKNALSNLGVVTHLEVKRTQQAEGGTGKPVEDKVRENDVQFEVLLQNVAAAQPREVFHYQMASRDVADSLRKLQAAVAGKDILGRVLKIQFSEQDPLNVTAHFDFDIPHHQKAALALDKALKEAGEILTRSTSQAPPGEIATDQKIGFRLAFQNVASMRPREKVILGLKVHSLKQTAQDLEKLVLLHKGTVIKAMLKQWPSGEETGELFFDVPYSQKDPLVGKIREAGVVRIDDAVRDPTVPASDLATVHVEVSLINIPPIVPSDAGLWPRIRTSLFYTFEILSWTLIWLVMGLSVLLPVALIGWGIYKVARKLRKKTQPVEV